MSKLSSLNTASCVTVGDVRIGGRVFLAPMSGITDVAFRKVALRFGAPMVISEMVASDELVLGSLEAKMRAERPEHGLHVVQIAGCDARWMAEAATVAVAGGADIIDINMGCPAKRVTGGYAGSALMCDLDHASRLIEATIAAVTVPVTVKMRLGWDHASLNAAALAARAEQAGAALITVHGRTRQQFYKGCADWQAVAAVRDAITIPLVVNGDIVSAETARKALCQSGADAVMIGRAALGRPWLIGDVSRALSGTPPVMHDASVLQDAIVSHYEDSLSLMGVAAGVRHARKHLSAYCDTARALGMGEAAIWRSTLLTSEDPNEIIRILCTLFPTDRRRAA